MTHVCHFRQALALDERRVRFWPEYADRLAYRPLAPGEGLRADVKEVWFAGSHSDVGGYKSNEKLSQFSPALRWMTYEAVAHGLQMTPFGGEWNDNKPQTNSLKGLWHIPELLPVLHPDHLSDESSQRFHRTRKLHFAAPRRIFEGQRIHESVLAAMLNRTWNYQPTACFHDGENRWADALESHEFVNTWLERDPITSAQRFVEQIRTGMREGRDDPTSIITTLEGYTSSPMRLRSLAEVKDVVSALTNHLLFPELERPGDGNSTGPRKEMYCILFSILISIPPMENDKISISRLRDLVSRLHLPYGPDLNIRQPSRDIILRHGDGRLSTKPHQCHSSQVLFIAVSENDQCIFSASSTEMSILCLKNLSHPAQIPFRSEEPIKSVAISADGQYLALGSSIAGVETRRLNLLDHATGHRELLAVSRARRVAFSPDGLKIAAALDDSTIKIYNRISADDPAIRILIGHRDWIRFLAFSPNGYYLVSGSDDCTIRVWDVSADNLGQQTVAVKVINSGQGVVRTVAVHLEYQTGPNEETEGDRTIQPTSNTVLGNHQLNPDASIQGPHIADINTFEDTTSVFPRVARTYTPALTIISGSDDGSICIHREGPEGFMKTEKLEERHSTWIRCVAISQSGDMIASASDDCTIRCWEVKAEKGTKTVAKYHTKSAVCSLAFSKDGKKLVTGNYLGEIQVWDADVLL
ncbi:hypothetical protein PTI98_011612 [Pleurotus ostreatus]|nr:hypothetical protein PTI98_011612 [Pleurotus ostreatus]